MISAIVVNYRTGAFLPGLVHQLLSAQIVTEVIVADNSGEVAAGGLLTQSARVRIMTHEENIGFGPAVNRALTCATGEWVLVANPDLILLDGCLEALIEGAERYGSPLAGPRFYWDRERIFRLPPATGASLWLDTANMAANSHPLDAALFSFYWTLRHDRFWGETEPFFEPFLQGACILAQRAWIEACGGSLFDDRFFLYFEDTDLCARAVLAGVRPLCIPGAEAVHFYDQAPAPGEAKQALMSISHDRFVQKHYTGWTPPVLPGLASLGGAVDLGVLISAPLFESSGSQAWEERCFFEIGVNPWLVPFAQAPVSGTRFAFPPEIWAGLSPGRYVARVRHPVYGDRGRWQWTKA
jgi:GT2 family glycosyltransferase